MLNFGFLDKDLRIGSPAHFVYDFLTEMFFMLYSINLANFIAWLFLLLEMLGNICIAIVFFIQAVTSWILIFLIKPFFPQDQKVKTKT